MATGDAPIAESRNSETCSILSTGGTRIKTEATVQSTLGVFDAASRLGFLGSSPSVDETVAELKQSSLFFDQFTGYGLTFYLDQIEAGAVAPASEASGRLIAELQFLRTQGLLLEPSQFNAEDEFDLLSPIDSEDFGTFRLLAVELMKLTNAARQSWLRSGSVEKYPELLGEMEDDAPDFSRFEDLETGAVVCEYIGDLAGVFQEHLMAYGLRQRGLSATVIDPKAPRIFSRGRKAMGGSEVNPRPGWQFFADLDHALFAPET